MRWLSQLARLCLQTKVKVQDKGTTADIIHLGMNTRFYVAADAEIKQHEMDISERTVE